MTARDIALGLPDTTEEPHHDRLSYRVAENPDCCEPVRWGARLAAVRVDLAAAGDELLTDAWRRRAPAAAAVSAAAPRRTEAAPLGAASAEDVVLGQSSQGP